MQRHLQYWYGSVRYSLGTNVFTSFSSTHARISDSAGARSSIRSRRCTRAPESGHWAIPVCIKRLLVLRQLLAAKLMFQNGVWQGVREQLCTQSHYQVLKVWTEQQFVLVSWYCFPGVDTPYVNFFSSEGGGRGGEGDLSRSDKKKRHLSRYFMRPWKILHSRWEWRTQ